MENIQARTIALHRIDIATPCTASWDEMRGDDRVRHCNDCNKNVFNLSAMPEAEAADLLAENHSGELCVRFYRRTDGTLMTSDCGTSQRAQVRQAWRKLPGVAGMAVLALSAAACSAGEAVPVAMPLMGAPPATPQVQNEVKPVKPLVEQAAKAVPAQRPPTPPTMELGKARVRS